MRDGLSVEIIFMACLFAANRLHMFVFVSCVCHGRQDFVLNMLDKSKMRLRSFEGSSDQRETSNVWEEVKAVWNQNHVQRLLWTFRVPLPQLFIKMGGMRRTSAWPPVWLQYKALLLHVSRWAKLKTLQYTLDKSHHAAVC